MLSIPWRRKIGSSPGSIGLAICFALGISWCLYVAHNFLSLRLIPSPHALLSTTILILPKEVYDQYFPDHTLPRSLRRVEYEDLAERLVTFLARPIHSYEDAKEEMERGCPREVADHLVDQSQLRNERTFWTEEVDKDEVIRRRAGIIQNLADLVGNGTEILGKKGGGRGMVFTGGNKDTAERLITVLRYLRRLGNTLDIEVFHYDGEMTDDAQKDIIRELGAKIRMVEGVGKVDGAWKNWQIKGMAIIQSSFQEVLYLDSDNIPLRRIEHLFTVPSYLSHGAVFWPDLSKDHPDNSIWRIVGETCNPNHWTFESGQIMFDKAGNNGLNLAALWIATGMMLDREFWFRMTGGDKDTFRWGMRILGLEWSDSPRWMSALGFKNGFESGRFCGHTTLQYDIIIPEGFTEPPPLFVHSNLLKHMWSGDLQVGELFTHVKHFVNDNYSNPNLNYAHTYVYDGQVRGMCLDVEWQPSAKDKLSAKEMENGIEEIPVDEIAGKPFTGFEEAYFAEGGRREGW